MRFVACGAVLAAALISVAIATTGKASGLSSLHQHVQVSDRVCMVGHNHYGESGAWATKEQAQSSAAWSWGWFTGLEYGDEWSDFRLASNQELQCNPVASDRGANLWSCKAQATPCRPSIPGIAMPPQQSAHHQFRMIPRHHAYRDGVPSVTYDHRAARSVVELSVPAIHGQSHTTTGQKFAPTFRSQRVWRNHHGGHVMPQRHVGPSHRHHSTCGHGYGSVADQRHGHHGHVQRQNVDHSQTLRWPGDVR